MSALFAALIFLQTSAWEKDLDSAKAKAAEEKLPLLILFGESQDANQKMFDGYFEKSELKGWRQKTVAVWVLWDREDPWAQELGIVGCPTVILYNAAEADAKKAVLGLFGETKMSDFPAALKNAYGKIHGSFFFRTASKFSEARRVSRRERKVILLAMWDDGDDSKTYLAARDQVMADKDKTLLDAAQKTVFLEADAKAPPPQEEADSMADFKPEKTPTVFFIEPSENKVVLKIEGKMNAALLKKGILEAVKKANLDAPSAGKDPNPGKMNPGKYGPGSGKFPKKP